jgi:lipid-A-disaccharide synthase-like uncharacterized protein
MAMCFACRASPGECHRVVSAWMSVRNEKRIFVSKLFWVVVWVTALLLDHYLVQWTLAVRVGQLGVGALAGVAVMRVMGMFAAGEATAEH